MARCSWRWNTKQKLRKENFAFSCKWMLQEYTVLHCHSYCFSLTWQQSIELYQIDKDIHNIKVSTAQNLLHEQLQVEVRVILSTSYLHHSFGLFNEYKHHNCSVITDIILIPAKSSLHSTMVLLCYHMLMYKHEPQLNIFQWVLTYDTQYVLHSWLNSMVCTLQVI